ncbi:hypothetical protein JAAARDRAFT_68444 [Jaapia argillacea MUCL 33604]|uniref:DUF6593 domain-containing protein n=1 Tax=Jaapia argillacea MUCL 33604 TaxID=933084 RepID=A0A067PYP0_9AGAM|nr:hypothetical protein JAAARDRAFT_68444 [Jaapia argillacea MUCL 33604]
MSGPTPVQILDPTPIPDVSILVLGTDATSITFYPLGHSENPLYSSKTDESGNNTKIRHENDGRELASIHKKKNLMSLRGGPLIKVKSWLVDTKEPVHGVCFKVGSETYTWDLDPSSRLTLYSVHSKPVAWYTPSDRNLQPTSGPPSITRAYLALTPEAENFREEIIISYILVLQKRRSSSSKGFNVWALFDLLNCLSSV